jgi:heme-degrading monooxygenase HmoA
MFLLIDRAADRSITISLWEDEAQLDAFLTDERTQQDLGYHHFAAGPVGDERFEVAECAPEATPGAGRFARVVTYDVQPGRMEERLRHQEERMCPAVHAQPGFQGHLVLIDRARQRTMVVTIWESDEARRRAFEQVEVRDAHPHALVGASDHAVGFFEVTHQE